MPLTEIPSPVPANVCQECLKNNDKYNPGDVVEVQPPRNKKSVRTILQAKYSVNDGHIIVQYTADSLGPFSSAAAIVKKVK